MCTTCGCSHGEIRIEGSAEEAASRPDHHGTAPTLTAMPTPEVTTRATTTIITITHMPARLPARRSLPAKPTPSPNLVSIEQSILAKNQRFADENRSCWSELGILSLNLVSSPGAGKTSLLVKTLEALRAEMPLWVIEGDQETSNDADRIRQTGVPAIQINTGRGCHLDAHAVGHAAADLALRQHGILFIENVGNLVCPAGFDLGETKRVVILSVTEGTDKPIKYPDAFAAADIMVLSKLDLLPHVDFDASTAIELAKRVNPAIRVVRTSVTAEGRHR